MTTNITRRTALKAAPAVALTAAMPAIALAVEPTETMEERIARLIVELATALMDQSGRSGCDIVGPRYIGGPIALIPTQASVGLKRFDGLA